MGLSYATSLNSRMTQVCLHVGSTPKCLQVSSIRKKLVPNTKKNPKLGVAINTICKLAFLFFELFYFKQMQELILDKIRHILNQITVKEE